MLTKIVFGGLKHDRGELQPFVERRVLFQSKNAKLFRKAEIHTKQRDKPFEKQLRNGVAVMVDISGDE